MFPSIVTNTEKQSRIELTEKVSHVCTLKLKSNEWTKSGGDLSRKRIRSWITLSDNHRLCGLYFRSQAAIENERKRHYESKYWYMIHPFSKFRTLWEGCMCIAYLISFFYVPFAVTFNPAYSLIFTPPIKLLTTAYETLSWLFLLDIFLNFYTGIGQFERKKVILDRIFVAKYYMKRYFIFDVLSIFPPNWGNWYTLTGEYKFDCTLVHLLRIIRFNTFLSYMDGFTELGMGYRICRLSLKTIIVLHWTACSTVLVPNTINTYTGQIRGNWLHTVNFTKNLVFPNSKRATYYTIAIQRALAELLNVGWMQHRTNSMEDLIFVPIVCVFGVFFVAYVSVAGIHIVLSRQASHIKYLEIMNQLQEYMRHKQLPLNIQSRLISFYEYRFQLKYFREYAILDTLSTHLKQEITLFCCRRLVENVDLFTNLPRHVIGEIIDSLKHEVFLPNDIIIKAGVSGDCMYFLSSGTVAVYTTNGKELCHLEDGAYFGEIALLTTDQKRIATVVAIEICEVYRLDRRNFRRSFAVHTELSDRIERIAKQRLSEAAAVEETQKFKGRTHTLWTNSQ